MRDQPFKRFFPSEKKLPSNYKYPTYQHYYEPKVSDLAVVTLKQQIQTAPQNLEKVVSPPRKRTESVKGTPKRETNNLKTELQHLKNEVQKIMQKKQGILRSPIKRSTAEKNRQQQAASVDDSDSQSVSSDKIFGQAKRKLQASRNTASYDYSKYMELQNNLLKTELRNLKNKYLAKKKELTQKCDGLEQKVNFLEKALYKSEQELANEVTSLKEALQDAQKMEKDIPTSDKQYLQSTNTISTLSHPQNSKSQLIAENMKSLYEELNIKNNTIAQKQDSIQKLEAQIRKQKRQNIQSQQKSSNLQKLLQASKINLDKLNNRLENANIKMEKLQKINEQLTNAQNKVEEVVQKDQSISLQQDLNQKLSISQGQKVSLRERIKSANEQLSIRTQQLKLYQNQLQQKQFRLKSLNEKYQYELVKNEQMESNFSRTMEITQKRHQQLVKSLQSEIYSKISALTPKKSIKERAQKPKSNQNIYNDIQALQNQIKRWKIQYKILKQRHDTYMKLQNQTKSQGKEHYRIFRESRQKIQILANKKKLLEHQSQRNRKYLTEKDAQILKKEVEIKKMTNQLAALKTNHSLQVNALSQKCKGLEEKWNEQVQRYEKQVSYLKQMEEKLLAQSSSEEAGKDVIDRLKKRLLQQDQKIAKNIKEMKNKDNLIQKLKQQLREYMQSSQTNMVKKVYQQMSKMSEQYLKQQQTALIGYKSRLQQEEAYIQELQKKYLDEIEQLKLANFNLKRQMVEISNELRLISHSYNTKTAQLTIILFQRSHQIQSLQERLQETEIMAMTLQSALREEANAKDEQIQLLRTEIFSKFITSTPTLNGTFDEVLRNQIEGNNKLKQQASKRTEQIYKLRDNCMVLRSQYENMKSQNDINKVKYMSQKKNLERAYQVEVQNYKNLLESCQKKVVTLQQKIKMMIEQNQKKDIFIKNFMMGKAANKNDKQIIANFMREYETAMQSKTIVQRLLSQSKTMQTLQKYNESLLKQIAVMKEKLFLFESIDIDQISLYESRISRKSQQSIEKELHQVNQPEFNNSRLKKTVSMQDMAPFESTLDG